MMYAGDMDINEVLDRFRAGLEARRFTLADMVRLTGIARSTLQTMISPFYARKMFDNIETLKGALDKLDSEDDDNLR